MATCGDIATRALTKLQATALGQTPDAASFELAMGQLQSSLLELLGGALGRLYDVAVTTDATAFPGMRIRCDVADLTITNPATLPYWWWGWSPASDCYDMPWLWWGVNQQTVDTITPPNMACAVVVDFDKTEHVWVYNAYVGAWADIANIQPSDPFPLSRQLETSFAAMVAMDLMAEFPEQSQLTVAALQDQVRRGKTMLATKFDNPSQPANAEYW